MTTFLQISVNSDRDEIKEVKIYAFGSALFSDAPGDIDLAIVFDPTTVGIDAVLEFRRHLQRRARGIFEVPLDICLLTEGEARNNGFLEEERAVRIYG